MNAPQALHLKDIIDTRLEQPPVWIAFPGSKTFQVLLRPVGNRIQELREAAQEIDWDQATYSRVVKVNQDKYLKLFCELVIVDWKGLTLADLRHLVLILDFKKSRQAPGPVVCDEGSKLLLMKHSPAFSAWVHKLIMDIERFNQEREEELEKKPLRPSASGSTSRRSTAGSAGKTTKRTALNRIAATARLIHGTGRPSRSLLATTWPAPGTILINSGWRNLLKTLRSLIVSGQNSGALCLPSIGR